MLGWQLTIRIIMTYPKLAPHHPRLGNALTSVIGKTLLKLIGWRLEGPFPQDKKFVISLAPHTSNWDFFIAIFSVLALKMKANWMAKHQIFVWPIKGLLIKMGGIPVNRKAPGGLVQQVVDEIEQSESMIFALAPEGTRTKVDNWKNGFLRIAKQANVPVYMGYFDAERKVFGFSKYSIKVDDIDEAMAHIRAYYKKIPAIHPENTD